MVVLLLKLFLAPGLVVASTLAGRRWGPAVTGILVTLPIVAGPILYITYREHGGAFAGDAASAALLGVVSLAVFAVVFARVARWCGWLVTLLVSWGAVLAADVALSFVRVPDPVALALAVAACVDAGAVMPRAVEPAAGPAVRTPRAGKSAERGSSAAAVEGAAASQAEERAGDGTAGMPCTVDGAAAARPAAWDLPGRAVATAVLVVSVTAAAGALGPRWTGILALFPIATSVVAAFVHAQSGPAATARTLGGVLTGLLGFAMFCVTVAALVEQHGGVAFAVAGALAVVAQLAVVRVRGAA